MKKIIFILFIISSVFAQNTDLDDNQKSAGYYLYRSFQNSSDRLVVDNHPQDQITAPFHYYLMREDKTDITLVSTVTIGEDTFIASASHGFTAGGEFVSIFDNERYTQVEVMAVSDDTITIASPFAYAFSTASTVIRGSVDMNVDADTTSQEFVFNFRNGTIPVDIQHIHVSLQHTTAGDDSKFGDLTELTNGVYFRIEDGTTANLGNYRINQDFRDFGSTVTYADKAGGGNHSTGAEFNIKEVYGIVFRIDPTDSTIFKARVRDDLSNLVRFRIPLMGQFTEGE